MTKEEAIERFNGIINAMSISIAQSKFYPSKAELDELCNIAIEALSEQYMGCHGCRHYDSLQTSVICYDCSRAYKDRYKE